MSDQNRLVSQLRHLAKVRASNQPMTFINMTPVDAMTESLAAALIERQAEELAAAKVKHYEECAAIAASTPHRSGVNADRQTWLAKATRDDCTKAIRAAIKGEK